MTDQVRRSVHVSQVPFIVNTLWDALLDLDDLTASTNSIMTLLSLLLTYPQVQQCRSAYDVLNDQKGSANGSLGSKVGVFV